MTTSGYDDIQKKFFAESSAYQTIDMQRMVAEAHYLRAKELARLGRLARAAVAGFFRATLLAPVVRWYRRRKFYQELMRLDDRTLADIGILRCDIPKVVRNSYGPRNQPHVSRRPSPGCFLRSRRRDPCRSVPCNSPTNSTDRRS